MPDEQTINPDKMPHIPGLRFRHFQGEADYAPIATVLTASQKADQVDRTVTAENISKAYTQSLVNCDPFTDMIIAEVTGQMVGYVRGWWEQESDSLHLYKHNGMLVPEWRRKGIGRSMLLWMENRLKEIASTHPIDAEKYFQANVTQSQPGAAALFENTGYQPVRYFIEMVRPNLEDITDFPLPEGLEILPATEDQYRVIWDSIYEGDQEEWGSSQPTEEAYQEWIKDPLFQPHLWQIAWDKQTGRPVGHVLTYIHDEENKQFNRKRGYTEGIGTSPAWRGRGVASALISRSLKAQKSAGMTESGLVVDSDNASGAIRLYEKCGFKIVKKDTIYRKPVFN